MERFSIITQSNKFKKSNKSNSMSKFDEMFRELNGRISNDSIDKAAKTFLLSENRFMYFQKGLIYSKILKNGSMKNLYDSIIKNKLKYNNNVISKKNENVKFRIIIINIIIQIIIKINLFKTYHQLILVKLIKINHYSITILKIKNLLMIF